MVCVMSISANSRGAKPNPTVAAFSCLKINIFLATSHKSVGADAELTQCRRKTDPTPIGRNQAQKMVC